MYPGKITSSSYEVCCFLAVSWSELSSSVCMAAADHSGSSAYSEKAGLHHCRPVAVNNKYWLWAPACLVIL